MAYGAAPKRKRPNPGPGPGGDPGPTKKKWEPSWKPDWKPSGGGGGGGGKGGGGGAPKRKGGGGPLAKEAKRDVMLSYKPYRRELKRTTQQGTQDYRMMSDKMANIYNALGTTLGGLPGADYAGISSQLSNDVGNLSSLLGNTVAHVPPEEIASGLGVVGSIGAGGLTNIASQAARAGEYNTSAQRQGAIENTVGQRNALHELLNFKDDMRQQRVDAASDLPGLIKQRLAELRDQKFEQSMALQQLALQRLQGNRSYGLSKQSMANDQRMQQLAAQMFADMAAAEAKTGRRGRRR